MTALKECPNCGSEADKWEECDPPSYAIYCSGCPLGLEDNNTNLDDLTDIWNDLPRNE